MTPTQRLSVPFAPNVLGFLPSSIRDNRCLALPYIDARDVMGRLDECVGPGGWRDEYDFLPDGCVVCRLQVYLDGQWCLRMDVGGPSDQKDVGDKRKAAVSDALKRAAVKFGVGRYLYYLDALWADYDPQRKVAIPPKLPLWALPNPDAADLEEAERTSGVGAADPAMPLAAFPQATDLLATCAWRIAAMAPQRTPQQVLAHMATAVGSTDGWPGLRAEHWPQLKLRAGAAMAGRKANGTPAPAPAPEKKPARRKGAADVA